MFNKLFKNTIYYLLIIGILSAIGLLFCKLIFPCLEVQRAKSRIDRYTDIIQKYAKENNLSPELIKAIIEVESKGKPNTVSKKGAVGLMQVMPSTMKDVAERLGIPAGNLKDQDFNIKIGAAYLRMMHDQFDNEVWFALAAYHAGPSRVRKWQKQMPGKSAREVIENCAYPQTLGYVRSVLKRQEE